MPSNVLSCVSERVAAWLRALPSGHSWTLAADAAEGFGLGAGERASIIVVGGRDASEVAASCASFRAHPAAHDAVILAALPDEQGVESVIEAGADDFFVESLGEDALRGRLRLCDRAAANAMAARHVEADATAFFDLCLDLLCVAGFDGFFKRVNPAWTTVLGWSSAELTSRPWLDFVHPDDREATIAAGRELVRGEAVVAFANRYRRKDGTYRWLEWQCATSVSGSVIYAATRDVTDGRAIKDSLRELSESLATTLYCIADGVIATDAAGAVLRMNPVAEQLTGWTMADAKGRPAGEVLALIDESTRQAVESPTTHALREGRAVGLPDGALLVRRDGAEVPIADSCAPIRTASGAMSGAVLVFRDLTAQRQAAATEARYQQQLIFADRMASVGTLAAGVAHEINNPLTYVAANVDTAIEEIRALAGGSASGRLKDLEEMLMEAREGAARITKIVRGLKTFSRLDEERRGPTDLAPVLEISINMAFNEIRHRGRLVKDYGKVPLVDADDARLGQVFVNLLVNAAQALPPGNADANEIRIATSTDADGNAVIEVRDTGLGIPPAVLARIFDPFFTTKPVGVGTGLGLAICHNIVTGMGGRISAESVIDRGSTFRVVLPASSAVAPMDANAAVVDAPPRAHATVLVVDDEPSVGHVVRRVLKGHDVTVVTSAKDALAALDTGLEVDVILSDLMMPGMSGMELYEHLARTNPVCATKMVFVTGGAFTPEAHAFLTRVANERIEKPFAPRQLREMVESFVK